MKTFKTFIEEEVPANAASSGNIAGIGVGPQGEPPGIPFGTSKVKIKQTSRKKYNILAKSPK